MYKLTIVTIYNTIELEIDNFRAPEVQEILSQPYIISYELSKSDKNTKVKRLIKGSVLE